MEKYGDRKSRNLRSVRSSLLTYKSACDMMGNSVEGVRYLFDAARLASSHV